MRLKYKFKKELRKITESDDQRERRARVAKKGADAIARTVIEFAEDMTDAGAQTENLDHRKVEENMVHVLEETFEKLESDGYDVGGMLDDGYVSETFGSDLKRSFQGKVSGKQQLKRIGLQGLQRLVDGISDKRMEQMFGHSGQWDGGEVLGYLSDLRKDAVDAIKIMKAVED